MLYLLLAFPFSIVCAILLKQWSTCRELQSKLEASDQAELEMRHEFSKFADQCYDIINQAERARDNAVNNLAMVLTSDPVPFDHVEVELGLNGVVYQFHSIYEKEDECSKEPSSLPSVPEPDLPLELSAASSSEPSLPKTSTEEVPSVG